MRLIEIAPAKINLALHVVGRRDDGYHLLDSLIAFADIGDELVARLAPEDSLTVVGPFARGLSAGDDNLVGRAVAAFHARWTEHLGAGVEMVLRKMLPVAAGLGGGSADAAAALRLMARLGEGRIREGELAEVAIGLGADVPACLASRAARMGGIGEKLVPLPSFPESHVVLVNPLVPVLTAEVFRQLASRENSGLPAFPGRWRGTAELAGWLETTRNDLEASATAIVPQIGSLAAQLRATPGCLLARMSGSGATVFGLFASPALAQQAAHELRAANPDCWVAAARLSGTEE